VSDAQHSDVLVRRADALAGGFSDGELARMVRRGELLRLQRGAYLPADPGVPNSAAERHRIVIAATVRGLKVPGVVSHASAAVLHGLPLWKVPVSRVHLIRRPPAGGSGSNRVHLHVTQLPDESVTLVDGMAVTDLTRTVVDLARTTPFECAVVAADAALASRGTTRSRLIGCLRDMGPGPGTRRASRVVAFADGRSESVGESRSRVLMQRLGLPVPQLQLTVRRPDGSLVGRSDFGWPDTRTLGEFDGRVKYGRLLRPGQQPGDAVFEEKRREDELRDCGWEVARWTWPDLDKPRRVGDRLQRAFRRGGRR
jgi:hypothetical protein